MTPRRKPSSAAEARQWIDANAPKELEAELSKSSLGRIRLQNHDIVEVGKAWQKKKADGRLGLPALAEGIWRPRRHARSRR